MLSQIADTSRLEQNNYPLKIGNIGFATDSMEIVVGIVPRGEVSVFNFDIYNFGKNPVTFINGKSNRFVSVNFEPSVLMPSSVGSMSVEVDVDSQLSFGEFIAELSIVSDDIENPYKFMNLIMNVVEGTGNKAIREMLDTVPAIAFDHYNYDFGHYVRGRRDTHSYVFRNIGGVPLIIEEIVTPKGIKIVGDTVFFVNPGEESVIKIKINTHGRVGVYHQSVLVYSNDPNNSLIVLGIHGSVRIYPSHKKTSVQCDGEQRY
ncbi:MAG: DUF1573 domain-containing protein [Bacteroidota bacterium]